MTKRKSNPDEVRVRESATYQSEVVKLDRENAVLRGVKILGWTSSKGRRYKRHAVEEALPLYQNAKVNLDHAIQGGASDLTPAHVKVQDRFGRLKNVEVRADGLFGDLHYNPRHSWGPAFEWFAENDPSNIGLSHDAILRGPMSAGGGQDIEAIRKVFSVDIVADPGSTRGLHESAANTDAGASAEYGGDPGDEDTGALTMDALKDDEGKEDPHRERVAELIHGYVCDHQLDKNQLRDKVLAALDLIDGEDAGDEEIGEETNEPEQEESDEMSAPAKPETPAQESASISPAEFEALKAQLKSVSDKSAAMEAELDTFRVKESIATKEKNAKLKLKTSGLPDELVTEYFVGLLTRANESEWENMIADRKVQIGGETPTSAGRSEGGAKPSFAEFEKHALSGGAK